MSISREDLSEEEIKLIEPFERYLKEDRYRTCIQTIRQDMRGFHIFNSVIYAVTCIYVSLNTNYLRVGSYYDVIAQWNRAEKEDRDLDSILKESHLLPESDVKYSYDISEVNESLRMRCEVIESWANGVTATLKYGIGAPLDRNQLSPRYLMIGDLEYEKVNIAYPFLAGPHPLSFVTDSSDAIFIESFNLTDPLEGAVFYTKTPHEFDPLHFVLKDSLILNNRKPEELNDDGFRFNGVDISKPDEQSDDGFSLSKLSQNPQFLTSQNLLSVKLKEIKKWKIIKHKYDDGFFTYEDCNIDLNMLNRNHISTLDVRIPLRSDILLIYFEDESSRYILLSKENCLIHDIHESKSYN